jgi:hypothetical protein
MTEEFTLNWLAIGLLSGIATGLGFGVGPAVLLAVTRPLLAVSGRPAGRTMSILQTALDRQVLRQVGVAYQFRHAELQDHLATQYRRERGLAAPVPAQSTGAERRAAGRARTRPGNRRPAGRR